MQMLPCAVLLFFAAPVLADTHPCAAIAEDSKRLACYDQAFVPSNPQGAPASERNFGLSKAQLSVREPDAVGPQELSETVSKIATRQDRKRVVTLSNGQRWLLTEVNLLGRIDVGESVTIRKAALGSYKLITQSGIGLRAKRVD